MQPVMLCTHGSGVHEVLTAPLELLLLEELVELPTIPPVPLELLLDAPPVPLELLDVAGMPPLPLELLVALALPPLPLEVLELVVAVVWAPFEEPHPVARRPIATTEIADQS
jgi:hypothetical protein